MLIEIEDKDSWLPNSFLFSLYSTYSDLMPGYKVTGVYFLFAESDLVYVGKSQDIAKRVSTGAYTFEWDRFAFIECAVDEIMWKEFLYIGAYRPKHNLGGNGWSPYISKKKPKPKAAPKVKPRTPKLPRGRIENVIWQLNGKTKVAKHLGLHPTTVRLWVRNDRIPAKWQQPVLDLARANGINIEISEVVG